MKSTRRAQRTARGAAALATAAALAGTLAGCGSDHAADSAGGGTAAPSTAAAAPSTAGGAPGAGADGSGVALATIKGPDGVVLTITTAQREAGGFVNVSGTVSNTGSQAFTQATYWRGNEEALQRNGGSLAGATLVDLAGKKRYYVLRDTEGRCLCTTGLDVIPAHATIPVFAQFPAPPPTTTQVDFEIPTLPSASIVISK